MASVHSSDIPEVRDFMKEFWRMVREFWTPEDDKQYWQAVIDRADELTKKYPQPFCRGQCVEFISYLDNKWKRGKENGKSLRE